VAVAYYRQHHTGMRPLFSTRGWRGISAQGFR
jgi:hypothetical protein